MEGTIKVNSYWSVFPKVPVLKNCSSALMIERTIKLSYHIKYKADVRFYIILTFCFEDDSMKEVGHKFDPGDPRKWNAKVMIFISFCQILWHVCVQPSQHLWPCRSSTRSEEHEDWWWNHVQLAGVLAARRRQKCPPVSTELHQHAGRPGDGDGRADRVGWFHSRRRRDRL